MLANVLQDRKRALIMDTITGGDHSIRCVIPLKIGCALKLKTANMSLPSGYLWKAALYLISVLPVEN